MFIAVRAEFSDFEPGWDDNKELVRVQIPEQPKVEKAKAS